MKNIKKGLVLYGANPFSIFAKTLKSFSKFLAKQVVKNNPLLHF